LVRWGGAPGRLEPATGSPHPHPGPGTVGAADRRVCVAATVEVDGGDAALTWIASDSHQDRTEPQRWTGARCPHLRGVAEFLVVTALGPTARAAFRSVVPMTGRVGCIPDW